MSVSAHMLLEQQGTVTVSSAVVGQARTVVVDGVPYAHTVAGGEDTQAVAEALAIQLGDRATLPVAGVFYVSPSAPGLALTLTGSTGVLASVADVGCAAELKAALRLSGTTLDALLRVWLGAATEAADAYLGASYASLAEIPRGVRLGVYQFVRVLKEGHDQFEGVRSTRNQDRGETFADAAIGDRARRAGEALWYGHCADVSRVRAPR